MGTHPMAQTIERAFMSAAPAAWRHTERRFLSASARIIMTRCNADVLQAMASIALVEEGPCAVADR